MYSDLKLDDYSFEVYEHIPGFSLEVKYKEEVILSIHSSDMWMLFCSTEAIFFKYIKDPKSKKYKLDSYLNDFFSNWIMDK